ncbi:acyl-CoA dehydrogenase [Natrinema sp. DC36]|uniref:acyl-CoA dehydrogenase n=1 Tax=Natrinema sp. DC36 TaxID=2878680 RepID=UPI001CF0BCC2|nr:acyl-CoA dehydrogenase [Natrinema sp. DC36]
MESQVREYLRTMYNPDPQALKIILFSSSFILFLFLVNPLFENPYYIFGLVSTVLTLVAAIAILACE